MGAFASAAVMGPRGRSGLGAGISRVRPRLRSCFPTCLRPRLRSGLRPCLFLAALCLMAARAMGQEAVRPGRAGAGIAGERTGIAGERAWESIADRTPRGSLAQAPSEAPMMALEGAIEDSVYVVGPGDRFVLGIWGVAPLSLDLQVDLEGRLFIPQVGVVPASDRTLREVRRSVAEMMRRDYPRSTWTLSLVEAREFRAFVTGRVAQPGSRRATGTERVADLIARSGPLLDGASTRNVVIDRRDGTRVRADLERFRRLGDLRANPFVRDGDRVNVPTAGPVVEIYGAVRDSSGVHEWVEGERVSGLVELAGGMRPEALADSIRLVRVVPGRAAETLICRLPEVDPVLQAYDQVFVGAREDREPGPVVTLRGEVRLPGSHPIVEGRSRLRDALMAAGGFTADAAIAEATLTRNPKDLPRNNDPEYERLALMTPSAMSRTEYGYFKMKSNERAGKMLLDFAGVLADAGHADNIPLRDGDLIEVPALRPFIQVNGQVASPGALRYDPALTVKDYLRLAGGYSWNAQKNRVTLIRAGSQEWVRSDVQSARPLPGDVIWVPERTERSTWATVREGLLVLSQVATIVLITDQLTR